MNAHPHSDPAHSASAPLCPIPRAGIQGPAGIFLSIFLALAAATVGIGLCASINPSEAETTVVPILSLVAVVLLTIYLWQVTRSAKGSFLILLFVGIALFYFTNSIVTVAIFCGLLFSIGEGAFFLSVLPHKQLAWVPLIPVVAYAATLAVSLDPVGSIAALIPFPPMLVLAWGTRNSAEKKDGLTRVGVICATSLALGASLGVVILAVVYRHLGTLSPKALSDAIDALRTALVEAVVSVEIPQELGPEFVALMEEFLTYANVQNTVNILFNLLPAIFVVLVNLLAAFAQLLQHASLRSFGFTESLTERVRIYRMSLISCIIFPIACFVFFMENSIFSSPTGIVAQNVAIILLPGLALAGVLRVIGNMIRKNPRRAGCLFYLIIFIPILFFFAPIPVTALLLLVFSLFEVIGHIFSSIISTLNPPNDDDDLFGNPPKDR